MFPDDNVLTREKASHQIMTTTARTFDRRLPVDRDMTYGQMRRAIAEHTGLRVVSDSLPGDVSAMYDESLHAVIIDRRMTYVQKKCSLVHELFHWLHGDDTCQGVRGGRAERRARKETAMFLINPADYVLAEREFDGEPYLMACDLDVTVDVLEDYRRLLERSCPPHLLWDD